MASRLRASIPRTPSAATARSPGKSRLLKTPSSLRLGQREVSVHPDMGLIESVGNLDDTLRILASSPCLEVFGLDDRMLDRATELALAGIAAKPFDHAMLAGVLVRATRLWDAGERTISFCERSLRRRGAPIIRSSGGVLLAPHRS